MATPTHSVLSAFRGSRDFAVGDQVDASDWTNRELLERHRFIAPLPPAASGRGRRKGGEVSGDGDQGGGAS